MCSSGDSHHFPAGPWAVYPPPSFHLSVSPSLTFFFLPRNYSVHHQLRMDLADTLPCMWTCLSTLCVENILVRISLSATHCCHLSSPFCAWRRVGLCAASDASSGNERLQLDTHTQKHRLSLYVTSSSLLSVLAALLWTLSSLSRTLLRCS